MTECRFGGHGDWLSEIAFRAVHVNVSEAEEKTIELLIDVFHLHTWYMPLTGYSCSLETEKVVIFIFVIFSHWN